MSTNNFFRTFNSITPYPPGDAVNEFVFLTSGSYRGCGTGGGQLDKLLTAQAACSSSTNNSCSTSFFISFPSGSLQSGSSRVYSDSDGTTLAYPNGGNGFFHISQSTQTNLPLGINEGFACRIETGSYITDLTNCDKFKFNTASLSAKKASSDLACAETVATYSVFYENALTASATSVTDASFLYTKSAGELIRFDNAAQAGGQSAGYFKVISVTEPLGSSGFNFVGQSLYWASVGGTFTVHSFSTCGNGSTRIKSSTSQVFSGVCSANMGSFIFSGNGAYPTTGTTMYSSSIGNSFLASGYYKISGSALDFYWIKVVGSGQVESTGTCGPTP